MNGINWNDITIIRDNILMLDNKISRYTTKQKTICNPDFIIS